MKTQRIVKLFLTILLLTAAFSPELFAQEAAMDFNKPAIDGGDGISTGLGQIVDYVFYVFYLVGAIMLGIGGFKLKQGDMPGFGKSVAGGASLFLVPAAVKLFKSIGNSAMAG